MSDNHCICVKAGFGHFRSEPPSSSPPDSDNRPFPNVTNDAGQKQYSQCFCEGVAGGWRRLHKNRFLRGRQIAYLIYDYFRVTGIHDSVENYADLFTISLRNDDIQEFDSQWDGILLSMTKIPPDDILEGLYKLRI